MWKCVIVSRVNSKGLTGATHWILQRLQSPNEWNDCSEPRSNNERRPIAVTLQDSIHVATCEPSQSIVYLLGEESGAHRHKECHIVHICAGLTSLAAMEPCVFHRQQFLWSYSSWIQMKDARWQLDGASVNRSIAMADCYTDGELTTARVVAQEHSSQLC
jgi:hypothetical protein